MDRAGAECTRRGGVALRVPHAASTLYLIRLHRALLGRADSRSMRGSTRIRSAATLLRRSAAAPSACRSLRAVPPGQPLSSYSWAPQCAIGAAERDEIERAARQTLRVLQKEPDIFSQAAVEDPVEADVLAAVQAEAASALAAELRSVAAPAGAGDGRLYPAARGDLQLRIRNTFAVLEHGLIERGLEARLLVLAALCGEHLLLLGPPGTAKSALSRQLSKALDAPYFERQLTRFSVPEELFGPLCERDPPCLPAASPAPSPAPPPRPCVRAPATQRTLRPGQSALAAILLYNAALHSARCRASWHVWRTTLANRLHSTHRTAKG